MLKMVDGTGIIGVDMVCPLGATVSPPQPPNFDKVEMEGVGNLMLPNSLKAPLERLELIGNSEQNQYVLVKEAGTTSVFNFGVKWNEVNKIVLVADSITKSQHIFFATFDRELIGVYLDMSIKFAGLTNGQCNLTSEQIVDGNKHEIIFTFDRPTSDREITNIWDISWSKKIRYYRIGFYSDDVLIANFIPDLENKMFDTVSKNYISASIKDGVYKLEQADGDPAPDNPQEIKNAGRKSKNLFDINYFKDKSNLKMLQCEGFTLLGIICNVKPNTEYTLSANLSEAKYNLNIANKATRFSLTSSPTRTLISNDDGTLYIGFYGATADNVNMDDFMQQYQNIQLEERTVATDYEPYGHFLEMKITGKNLLSNKPTDWMIGKTTSWGAVPQTPVSYGKNVKNAIATINVKSSTNYSFINKETNKLWVCRIIELDANGLGLVNHALYANESFNYKKYNFSTRSNTANIVFEIKKVDNTELLSTDIESNKIMLVEGDIDESTPYEPYTEQTVQIAIDEPLRGIGEYKDTITKDGVARRIKRIVFDENTPFKEYNAPVQVKTTSFVSGTTIKDATGETDIEVMSDRFKAKDRGFDRYDEECITLFGKSIFVRFNKDKNINTAEALTEWLKQNPLTVDYVLAEPVTEPLPESVQQQLQALHSENGTTHVFVHSGEVETGIKLTYRKEK